MKKSSGRPGAEISPLNKGFNLRPNEKSLGRPGAEISSFE
jgi:hypothetical protein